MKRALLIGVPFMLASVPLASVVSGSPRPGVSKVSPEDLWWKTSSPTYTGRIHKGCEPFQDPEAMISKGPISKIEVFHAGFIHGIRLFYGRDGVGLRHGFTEGIPSEVWEVPEGERITRVEGEIAGDYVSRLQFFTDGSHSSRRFGQKPGKPFDAFDAAGGALRTISGSANLRRHPSLHRAVASMTFQFGAPYFIKSLEFDRKALEGARLNAAPELCATQDFWNDTSVEMPPFQYEKELEVDKTTTLRFEHAFGVRLGGRMLTEVGASLRAVDVKLSAELSWELSAEFSASQSLTNSRKEKVTWTVPVRVPPRRRVVATSTWRRYRASIPFTYTLAWYEGSRDNIKKEVTLPGLYEGVQVDDLKHVFKELPLE